MIEKIVRKYLADNLSVGVYMEEPTKAPKSYVVIERVGGSQKNHINSASFAVQSYAATLLKAAELDVVVKNVMDHITDTTEIGSAKLASNYNHTDTRKKKYRYQSVYDLTY